MSLLKNGLSLHSLLAVFSVLVLHHSAVFVLLTHSCAGQSQLIGPAQPILSILGDDIILPSHLDPAVDAAGMTVEWARPDLKPRFVYLWRDGHELLVHQNPTYEGRASLLGDKLELGDVSLKLCGVKLSDEGRYRCFIPSLGIETTVELVVGAASSPVLNVSKSSSGVVLECESKGWYPEPELFWLDAEGKLLSAGAPETLRGPDGLYTVSSRVTVEKSHSSSFTCRVQQSKTQQTRETQIHVPEDFFTSVSPVLISMVLAVGFLFVAAAVCLVCKWKRDEIKTKMCHEEEGAEKTKFINYDTENHAVIGGEGDGELGTTNYLSLSGKEKLDEDSDKDSFHSARSHFQGEGQETDTDSQTEAEVGRDQEQHMGDRQQRELDRKKAELEQPQKTTQTREESEGTTVMETKMEDNNEKAENIVNLEKTEKEGDEKLQPVGGEETQRETEKTDLKIQEEAVESGNQELQQATGLQVDSSETEAENQEDLQDGDQDAERGAETNETDITGEDQGGWENADCVTNETEAVHGRKTGNGTAEGTGEPERPT